MLVFVKLQQVDLQFVSLQLTFVSQQTDVISGGTAALPRRAGFVRGDVTLLVRKNRIPANRSTRYKNMQIGIIDEHSFCKSTQGQHIRYK